MMNIYMSFFTPQRLICETVRVPFFFPPFNPLFFNIHTLE